MNHVLALDIGGTNIRVGLFNSLYQKIKVIETRTLIGDLDVFLNQITTTIDQFSDYFPLIKAIACGVPGRVDALGGIDILPNIGIRNVPLLRVLKDRYHLPVVIRNDAVMAAIAEGNLGFGKDLDSSYFMTISTGIGGAFIRNHTLGFASDEIGHTLVPYRQSFYELEAMASGTGIVKLAAMNGLTVENAKAFFDRVRQHDALSKSVFEDWFSLISFIFTHIVTYYQPKALILTGGVMKSSDLFLPRLQQTFPKLKIAFAQFGQDAGLMGAANVAFSLI